jgi:hypothetical protein
MGFVSCLFFGRKAAPFALIGSAEYLAQGEANRHYRKKCVSVNLYLHRVFGYSGVNQPKPNDPTYAVRSNGLAVSYSETQNSTASCAVSTPVVLNTLMHSASL